MLCSKHSYEGGEYETVCPYCVAESAAPKKRESKDNDLLKDFERGFRDLGASSQFQCDCGKVYYNPSPGWDWDEGEIDALAANPNAFALNYAVEYVVFEGRYCVMDCECWKDRGTRIAHWLVNHQREIGEFFKERKERLLGEANQIPVIE